MTDWSDDVPLSCLHPDVEEAKKALGSLLFDHCACPPGSRRYILSKPGMGVEEWEGEGLIGLCGVDLGSGPHASPEACIEDWWQYIEKMEADGVFTLNDDPSEPIWRHIGGRKLACIANRPG